MVCIPCIVAPVLLFLWYRFIQPIVLKIWNPWGPQKSVKNSSDSKDGKSVKNSSDPNDGKSVKNSSDLKDGKYVKYSNEFREGMFDLPHPPVDEHGGAILFPDNVELRYKRECIKVVAKKVESKTAESKKDD